MAVMITERNDDIFTNGKVKSSEELSFETHSRGYLGIEGEIGGIPRNTRVAISRGFCDLKRKEC